MTRHLAKTAAVAVAAVAASLAATAPAVAQHVRGSGHYDYRPGHYDYHPTTIVPHGDHYDVQPGHYDYHPGGYDYHAPARRQPLQGSVVPHRPNYVSPPRTSYYRGEGHSHDHAGAHIPREIAFGGFSHIDDLAVELEQRANDLCLELHYNYQHNPGFRTVYREAYEILTTAKYIHGLEHAGNRDKLRQAAGELDGLFHHVQGHVSDWTGHRHRTVGYGGLADKVAAVEETLHHLMDDVGVRPVEGLEQAPPAAGFEAVPSVEVGPPPAPPFESPN